jgi:hypothetical protein
MPPDDYERMTVFYGLPADFPIDDLDEIGEQLTKAEICVPGFIPPDIGMFALEALPYAQSEGAETVLLPDRNVVSRMAQLADGRSVEGDEQLRLAAAMLALSQCFNVEIEPSCAFHELAHKSGNEIAYEELRRFRVADSAHALATIAVALGRNQTLALRPVERKDVTHDLAKPLRRWNRNYIISLKIVELEHEDMTSLERVIALLHWMRDEFMFGAPAALLAMTYLAPNSAPKKRVFKDRNSVDREAAIAGVKNAAWDVTHLSDFIKRVNDDGCTGKKNYIFVSFDKHLRSMARLMFENGTELSDRNGFVRALSAWWPETDAERLVQKLFDIQGQVTAPDWNRAVSLTYERVLELIAEGEAKIRARPGTSR